MQLTRCPTCHARIHLDDLIEDEAGRDVLNAIYKMPDPLATSMMPYLALFRPSKRDLQNSRLSRLINEVLMLCDDRDRLITALNETVLSLQSKQDAGNFKPLTSHGYLKRVLESTPATTATKTLQTTVQPPSRPVSKTAQGIELLKAYPTPEGIPEWFTRTVCGSLAELMLLGLDGVPAFDTVSMVAQRWLSELWPKREWDQHCRFRGAKRLHTAFMKAAEQHKRWPSVNDVLGGVPHR